MVKYNPKLEVLTFEAVQGLGEGTRSEVLEYMKVNLVIEDPVMQAYVKTEMDSGELLRYLGRWNAKKIMTIGTRSGEEVWKLSNVPPWFCQQVAAVLKLQKEADMKVELKGLTTRWELEGKTVSDPIRKWGDYQKVDIVFETIDPILGGRVENEDSESEEKLHWPRKPDGKVYIPPAWFYGWTRDNTALVGDSGTQYHVGFGEALPIGEVKTKYEKIKAKIGFNTFEAVPVGTRFKTTWRWPFRGGRITTEKELQSYLTMLGETPIRGLGSNPRAFGGRVRVAEMTVSKV